MSAGCRELVGRVSLFQWVKDADAVYREVTASGVTVTVDIGDRDYGVRDFRISGPNGLDVVSLDRTSTEL